MSPPTPSQPSQMIRAYGDRKDDGRIQLSFTLPVDAGARAKEAARLYSEKLGLRNVYVAACEPAGNGFSFCVVYATSDVQLDFSTIHVPEVTAPEWSFKELNYLIKEKLGRRVVVVGACTGSDAHTVGIDAILNIKGFAGEKGLEYYTELDVVNLGAQVLVPDLVRAARSEHADAVLISQVVTQKDAHIHNTTQMSAAFREAYPAGEVPLLVAGGPRFEEGSELRLGVDRIFGRGTTPGDVASYLVHALAQRSTRKDHHDQHA